MSLREKLSSLTRSSSSDSQSTTREEKAAPKQRPVTVDELPRLARASTWDIELHYAKMRARHRARRARGALREMLGKTGKVARRAATLVAVAPFLPLVLFFVLVDRIIKKLRSLLEDDAPVGVGEDDVDYYGGV